MVHAVSENSSGAVAQQREVDVRTLRQTVNITRGGSILLVGEPAARIQAAAQGLAQAAVCVLSISATGKDACGRCPACRKVLERQHPDVIWIEPRGPGGAVKIEDIRFLKERLGLKPYEAQGNVMIIAEAERMTVEAANALLKILEEPPHNSLIILTAASTAPLLPTVVSRCTIGRLHAVDQPAAAEAEDISRRVQAWFEVAGAAEEIAWAAGLAVQDRRTVEYFLRELVCVYRDAAILARCGTAAGTLLSRQPRSLLRDWALLLGPSIATAHIEEIMRLEELLRANVNVKAAIDALLAIMPWRGRRQSTIYT